ncbi:hypothetical protein AARI_18000 [Glutamicibacter arilaitensis Re117]|uniref:Uncharacterized protein n=1 Tax=Glutamicibacter arilaitensis (strain DSM 16368 / CIP 108037 / IAM 15318 / JCM 13566 / NCIMB 14258 / Re117) TaxID=861360 RepID=A0ABP1U5F7_GLUAR|nr:hypothetical protein AARI_18000 [Glutamicibacter arilaitensis Re117]
MFHPHVVEEHSGTGQGRRPGLFQFALDQPGIAQRLDLHGAEPAFFQPRAIGCQRFGEILEVQQLDVVIAKVARVASGQVGQDEAADFGFHGS